MTQNMILLAKSDGHFNPQERISFFACALLILWRPLYAYYLHIDGAGIFTNIILLSAFIINIKQIFSLSIKGPIALYWVLALYITANGLLKGGQEAFPQNGVYQLIASATTAPLLLSIIAPLFIRRFDLTVKSIAITLYFYTFLFLINTRMTEIGGNNRLSGDINANEAAFAFIACYLCLLLLNARGKIRLYWLILLSIPLFSVILLTGSRMALTMFALISIFTGFSHINFKDHKSLPKIIALICSIVIFFFVIQNTTTVGERFSQTGAELEEGGEETGTPLDMLGDRGLAYYISWPYFLDNPVTGIGFQRWRVVNPLGFRAHSEYMVMYLENGVIALALYIIFLSLTIRRIMRRWKFKNQMDKYTDAILLSAILSIIYANVVLWTFNEYPVFVIYAMCFARGCKQKRITLIPA